MASIWGKIGVPWRKGTPALSAEVAQLQEAKGGGRKTPKELWDAPERGRELLSSALSHRRSSFGCSLQPALILCIPVPPVRRRGRAPGAAGVGGLSPLPPLLR